MSFRELSDKMEEECGVFGVYSPNNTEIGDLTYLGLLALQHRGQESAGISVTDIDQVKGIKGMGLVQEVFKGKDLSELKGDVSLGHVRYSTSGQSTIENAQPLEGHCKLGSLAIAHNGNLINSDIIRSLLEDGGVLFQTSSDSEVLMSMIARGASKGYEKAVIDAISAVKGSFALLISIDNKLIGVRDPYGIRPLCIGKLGDSWFLSSESCALDAVDAEFVRDVEPGEIVCIDQNGLTSLKHNKNSNLTTCVFEYIYFARPDSIIDGIDVYQIRTKCGEALFKEYPVEADIVVGVPDSGIPAALGYSQASGIPYAQGFIKNRYVGRTFISPTQEIREKAVSLKLNVVKSIVKGKKILLIDDSIVRGTTSRRMVKKLMEAGAKEVHIGIVSPPVQDPCYFGIDTPNREDLIANNMNNTEICKSIGADSLQYLSLNGLLKALGRDDGFCLGCLNGIYPISTR
ncbi:MAG: amidophosphoribosyltransferase [Spirochaetaceae bacterium]|jgi:amidophosphoribosyltransferase|nr:amidophosphoribosyltransferase [Spirochaetaceae bacterium]